MSKWLKVTFFVLLLVGAGYFFGTVCRQIGQAYRLILFPSGELLNLLLWFLLALGAVAVIAGLVAALLRPPWVGIIAFALSGLAMLLGWQMTLGSGILILVYLLAASFYAVGVARELNERIRFSVRPISEGQSMFLMALILVACGSLYFGCAAHIEREGFSMRVLHRDVHEANREANRSSRAHWGASGGIGQIQKRIPACRRPVLRAHGEAL